MLPYGSNHELVPFASILYIKSNRKLSTVVTTAKAYTITRSLRSLIRELPEGMFFRSHKSYLVSLTYVTTISKSSVFVAGNPVPLSTRARTNLYGKVVKFG